VRRVLLLPVVLLALAGCGSERHASPRTAPYRYPDPLPAPAVLSPADAKAL
jgi:hypothetical protein